jgi:hypothetical protein
MKKCCVKYYPLKRFNIFFDDVREGPQIEYENTHSNIPDPNWIVVRKIEYMKELLLTDLVEDMSLDHDVGEGETGYDLLN